MNDGSSLHTFRMERFRAVSWASAVGMPVLGLLLLLFGDAPLPNRFGAAVFLSASVVPSYVFGIRPRLELGDESFVVVGSFRRRVVCAESIERAVVDGCVYLLLRSGEAIPVVAVITTNLSRFLGRTGQAERVAALINDRLLYGRWRAELSPSRGDEAQGR